MSATISGTEKGMQARGDRGKLSFKAKWTPSSTNRSVCRSCGGLVRQSWRTGITHRNCFGCRYLIMIYGPNIQVERA
jgi:hypothetical protein